MRKEDNFFSFKNMHKKTCKLRISIHLILNSSAQNLYFFLLCLMPNYHNLNLENLVQNKKYFYL